MATSRRTQTYFDFLALPQWLLANKQILEEDLKQFRLEAH
jgi:hypothetical protein